MNPDMRFSKFSDKDKKNDKNIIYKMRYSVRYPGLNNKDLKALAEIKP